jgi:hypothetical protein
MNGKGGRQLPLQLRQAVNRFARWRDTHDLGTRIPEQLWQLAVKLAAIYGVSRTALALKLDYYSLKRHLGESTTPVVLASPNDSPAFLELPPSTLLTSGACVIDFENSRGAKMRVHVKGMTVPDLVALSHSFWSAE